MRIEPFLPDKFIVCSFFLYLPVVQDDDPVRILDGLEPVRNGYDGAAFDERVDGFLHFHFIFGVKGGSRFVQQDDRRVLQDGAGNGYALLLPARQGAASFAHHRVIAFGQPHDEVVAAGAAAMISSSVASVLPKRMLLRRVS